MPPRKEKEIPKKYVDSEEEEETSQDTSEDQDDDKDTVEVLDDSLTSKKPALYDGKGRLLSTGKDLCDCLEQVCFCQSFGCALTECAILCLMILACKKICALQFILV